MRITSPRAARIWAVLAATALLTTVLGPPAQAATANNYPISGFFISASTNNQVNVDKLKAIKSLGGDTVVIFGNQLKPARLSAGQIVRDGKADPNFTDCKIGTAPCAAAVTAGKRIGRTFVFTNGSHFGGKALKCAADRNITSNGKLYTLLVIPTVGDSCTSSNGVYDLVAVYGGRPTSADPALSVSRAATTLGMKVYAGMPAPVKRTDLPWLPDTSYLATFGKFTERFVQFHASMNNVAGLAGFYHHTEMPLSDSAGFNSVLSVYRTQNAAIKAYMPTRAALVSPYIDARRSAAGYVTPANARNAVRNIANTASGIRLNIAIQDGMGTSKGGAYMGNEAGLSVDKYAAAYVGAGSWGSKYIAPTGDYFAAARAGITGTGAQLWANVEGMAPSGPSTANTCGTEKRGQSTPARLDRQIQQLGRTTTKTISFMWDDYFTCMVNGKTLASQVAAHGNEPIISDAPVRPAGGELTVAGYNLAGAKATLRYADPSGTVRTLIAKAAAHNARYGAQTGADPRMESARFQFGKFAVKAGSYYIVSVTNGAGKTNPAFYSKRF